MTDVHPVIEVMARAIEGELHSDFGVWLQLWGHPSGLLDDALDPPAKGYNTTPEKIARAALAAALDHMAEPSDGMLAAVHPDEDCDIVRQKVINACREMEAGFYRVMLAELRKEVLGDG